MSSVTHPPYEILRDFIFADCRLADSPKVRASIFLKQGETLTLIARTPVERKSPLSFPLSEGLAGKVFASKSYGLFPHLDLDFKPNGQWLFKQDDTRHEVMRSLLSVPILSGEQALGVINLDCREKDFFHERHVGQVQLLAGILAYFLSDSFRLKRPDPSSIHLGTALRRVREGRGLTQEVLAKHIGTSRIALSRWETGSQPPSYEPVRLWCETLGILQRESRTIAEIVDLTTQLVPLLRSEPELLHRISPKQFEQLVAERLDRMGYEVTLTGNTNRKDGGIDIIATPKMLTVGRFLLAAQVKHHGKGTKSGSPDVRDLLSWKNSHFRLGLVVTNTEFTADAKWVAEQHKEFLRLRDFEDLKRWLEGKFESDSEWREIPTEIEIAPGVRVPVPRPQILKPNEIWSMPRLDDKKCW